MFFGDSKINVPQFTGSYYNFDASKNTLLYSLNLSEPVSSNEKSVQITNIVYESIAIEALGDLNLKLIPKSPSAYIKTNQSRDLIQSFLILSPIVKDELGYKRIKSFSYSISNSISSRITQTNKKNKSNNQFCISNW